MTTPESCSIDISFLVFRVGELNTDVCLGTPYLYHFAGINLIRRVLSIVEQGKVFRFPGVVEKHVCILCPRDALPVRMTTTFKIPVSSTHSLSQSAGKDRQHRISCYLKGTERPLLNTGSGSLNLRKLLECIQHLIAIQIASRALCGTTQYFLIIIIDSDNKDFLASQRFPF